jgi:YHS domain-containing protein
MLRKTIVMVALSVGLLFSGIVLAADNPGKGNPQAICPIQGGKIDKSIYTDYQGKRIYFCCSGCIDDFKKDPDKYLKQMQQQGITLEQTPGAK